MHQGALYRLFKNFRQTNILMSPHRIHHACPNEMFILPNDTNSNFATTEDIKQKLLSELKAISSVFEKCFKDEENVDVIVLYPTKSLLKWAI